MIGLNVGSGQRPFESVFPEIRWVNIDKVSRQGCVPDLRCDGTHLPHGDGIADYFVAHHILEHLWQMDAKTMITEAYRVLKPGGSLLVFVPNMRALAIRWLEGNMDTQLYMTNVYGAYMGDQEDWHRFGHDEQSLTTLLMETPWSKVKPFDWREITGASICKDWWIIGMEAVK